MEQWLSEIILFMNQKFSPWFSENIGHILLVALLLVPILFIYYRRVKERDDEGIKELEASIGLFRSSKEYPAPLKELEKFKMFSFYGFNNHTFHVLIEGSKGPFDVTIFEHGFRRGNPFLEPFDYAVNETVALFQSDKLSLPHFSLHPAKRHQEIEGTASVIAKPHHFGAAKYYLWSDDEEQIRNIFNASVWSYLGNHTGWSIEGLGTRIFIYRKKKSVHCFLYNLDPVFFMIFCSVPPKEIQEFYEQTHKIFQLFL